MIVVDLYRDEKYGDNIVGLEVINKKLKKESKEMRVKYINILIGVFLKKNIQINGIEKFKGISEQNNLNDITLQEETQFFQEFLDKFNELNSMKSELKKKDLKIEELENKVKKFKNTKTESQNQNKKSTSDMEVSKDIQKCKK